MRLELLGPCLMTHVDPFEATQRYMRQPASFKGMGFILLFGVAIGTIWLVLYLWDRRRRNTTAPMETVQTFFLRLCQAHQLSTADGERLREQAQQLQLSDPALIFVDPRILESISTGIGEADFARTIGTRLFGAAFQVAEPRESAVG